MTESTRISLPTQEKPRTHNSHQELNQRQIAFVNNYILLKNATQSAIKAGYSQKTAGSIGQRLLKDVEIQNELNRRLQKQGERVMCKSDDVLLELKRIAMLDITTAFDNEGNLKPINEIPADVRNAIASIETDELFIGSGETRTTYGRTKKLRFHDKVKALQLLAQHFKLLNDAPPQPVLNQQNNVIVNLPPETAKKIVDLLESEITQEFKNKTKIDIKVTE